MTAPRTPTRVGWAVPADDLPTPPKVFGYAALNACTVLWGTQHAIIKGLVISSPLPMLVNAIRFSTAAVVTTSLRVLLATCHHSLPRADAHRGRCGLIVGAAELAVWQTLGFTLQLIGLNYTTASRSAFLLYLNATIVPVIATILGERNIGLRTWVCVLVAVAGTLLLVNDGGAPNVGDLWSLGAATASAMFIVRLTHAAKGRNAANVSAATLAFTSVGCWAIAYVVAIQNQQRLDLEVWRMVREHLWPLLYLSIVVSAAASWLQASGQQSVPPQEAAVIYTLDPVYGALFAWLLLGEQLHTLGWVGVCLVVIANLLRRLPWQSWPYVKKLVTPQPSEADLASLETSTPEMGRRQPLLGTPKTPTWFKGIAKRWERLSEEAL